MTVTSSDTQAKKSNWSKPLLVHFSAKGSPLGASRTTLKEIAEALGVSETRAIHIALNRFHTSLFPERHIGEVTPAQFMAADAPIPEVDPIISKQSLFDLVEATR